ncbi:MAG: Plug domain-containing protein, partial [Gammaproteobacteria bacterium]|nr:Plug domain-containing protein [Gammaproteobacteria bacterium]
MRTTRLAALAALLVGWWAAPALAEDERERGAAVTEEIIVTATYRETNLMDTAQSINAVTDDLVEAISAQSMEDIFTLVPGLAMSGGMDGENRYSIRGLTSQTGATQYYIVGATVGVYLDGTPVTAALGPDAQVSGNLFDIERVEVLKGPQGTLFGEGSQGGTIRYLYKQPDPTAFDSAVNASY